MTLPAGARLGPYEIVSPLGAGGMGEVYRGTDTRLSRPVAIKILPAHLSSSPELRERFEREARAISSLNHAHICTLYDIGRQDGVDFLVMEYLEGETLASRLAKGPLPPDQVVRFGIQIAEALDKAHRQGIVHRDLKPGNVMLTKAGAKLLDFGLAKFKPPSAAPVLSAAFTSLPTEERPLTAEGSIVGTFQYMAPEQLEGKEPDARTDIFAFGAVLYEMATGRKAFTGRSQASLIGSILKDEPPPISTLQPMTPPALDRVVRTCLAKEPDERWQNAHDLVSELRWIAEAGSQAGVPAAVVARRKGRERLAWATAAAAILLMPAATYLALEARRQPARMVQASILPPEKVAFDSAFGPVAVSPDGRRVVFVARGPEGNTALWVRPLHGLSAQALTGTTGASYPFWSPDSRFIGFFADGKLKKIEASGGPPQTLCDAAIGRGGTWSREGVILFAPGGGTGLSRVSASGGPATPVTQLDATRGETSHRWPSFLPDGRHFLYLVFANRPESRGVYVGTLDSKDRTLLLGGNSRAIYTAPGHVLFFRERTLLAQPFDAGRLQLGGDPVPVAEQVQDFPSLGIAVFSASEDGVLAYEGGSGGGLSDLAWLDRAGKAVGTVGTPGNYFAPRLSHDGRRLAVVITDAQSNTNDIWTHDLGRGVATRFTFDPADDIGPVWSPDDSEVLFASNRKGVHAVYRKVSTGAGREEELFSSSGNTFPLHWSAAAGAITMVTQNPSTRNDVVVFSLADRKAVPFLQTEFSETAAQLSPDGRWAGYHSDESGRNEVYVQPYPAPGGKWQVSNAGGTVPVWRRDGKEIFYLSPDRKLMAVEVRSGVTFEVGIPRELFETRIKVAPGRQYDVSADGQRFLVNSYKEQATSAPITLVLNWAADLKK